MREIKFRGKDITTGEWRYGSLVNNLWGYSEHHSLAGWPVCEIIESGECSDYDDMQDKGLNRTVIPGTVGQFTGLKDKKGKEIYEGDICRGPNGKHWIIEWEGYSWSMNNEMIPNGKMKFGGTETYTIDEWLDFPPRRQELEIIGNIYENSELLTQTQHS